MAVGDFDHVAMNAPVLVATAGHVDHGKSTLVRVLTGMDPDRWAEEKRRGVTIDLGYAHLDWNGRSYSFIDVPGHEKFIHNMLAGVGSIDAVLMVIAADESIMPQTREHALALRYLGVDQVIVALTKIDLVDEDLTALLHEEVDEWLAECGWSQSIKVGFSAKRAETRDQVLAALATLSKKGADPKTGFRLSVDRVFTQPGAGSVVTGTVDRGSICAGQEVCALPAGISGRVRQLQLHGVAVEEVGPHSRLAINLTGVHYRRLHRGDAVFTGRRPQPAAKALVRLTVFDDQWEPGPKHEFHIHHLAARRLARMLWRQGDFAALELRDPYPFWAMDRGLIRDGSPVAIRAGFEVTHPNLRRAKLRQVKPLLERPPASGDLADWQRWALSIQSGVGDLEELEILCGESLLPQWRETLVTLDGRAYVTRETWAVYEKDLLRGLEACHRETPIYDFLPLRRVQSFFLDRKWPRPLLDKLFAAAATAGSIEASGDRVKLAGHRPDWSPARMALLRTLLKPLSASPPVIDLRLVRDAGRKDDLAMVEGLLVWERYLVNLTPDLLISTDALNRMIRELHARFAGGELAVSELKDMFSFTRKTAIPLLEHLDKLGCTQRTGEGRRWIASKPPRIECRWTPPDQA